MCPARVSVRATFGEPSLHPAAIEGVFSDCSSPCPAPAPLVVDTTVESPSGVTMDPGATLHGSGAEITNSPTTALVEGSGHSTGGLAPGAYMMTIACVDV